MTRLLVVFVAAVTPVMAVPVAPPATLLTSEAAHSAMSVHKGVATADGNVEDIGQLTYTNDAKHLEGGAISQAMKDVLDFVHTHKPTATETLNIEVHAGEEKGHVKAQDDVKAQDAYIPADFTTTLRVMGPDVGAFDFSTIDFSSVQDDGKEHILLVVHDADGSSTYYDCKDGQCDELAVLEAGAANGTVSAQLWGAIFRGFVEALPMLTQTGYAMAGSPKPKDCLPADAMVTAVLADAPPTLMPIASVPIGASVLTTAGFSPIYLYSHYTENAIAIMSRIETSSGFAVELSPHHYIRACNEQDECAFTAAKNVVKNMRVELLASNGTIVSTIVDATTLVEKRGLYNPHTIAGDIIVASTDTKASGDLRGVVVSDTSEWFAEGYIPEAYIPALYHAVLAPVRMLFRLNPAWLKRFHERTVKLLEEQALECKEKNVFAGSLDQLGTYELAMSASVTLAAGLIPSASALKFW